MNEEYKFGQIYKITNKINGKIYIGQTLRTLDKRLNEHSRSGSGCLKLKNAIRKHGKENFKIEFLGTFIEELLDLAEMAAIKEYKAFSKRGYNLREGGLSSRMSEQTKNKISKANTGRLVSAETRKKLSIIGRKRKHTPEELIKMSLAQKGRKQKPFSKETLLKMSLSRLGKKRSKETCEKIRIANLGTFRTEETKRKMSFDRKGEKNYTFGKKWISNKSILKNAMIKKDCPLPEGWEYGRIKRRGY